MNNMVVNNTRFLMEAVDVWCNMWETLILGFVYDKLVFGGCKYD